jgi:predicted dienelactone hydrolase
MATGRGRVVRGLTLVALAALVAVGCSSGHGKSAPTSLPGGVGTGGATHLAVGRRLVTFVDRSRPTPAVNGHARLAARTMPTLVLYPAVAPGGTKGVHVVDGAAPRAGRLPMVVFLPGIGSTGADYQSHLVSWAAAGYVVASPTLPVANGRGGSGVDYRNDTEDLGFVISSMLGAADPLRAHVDPAEVAVAGHSIGAQTVLGHVYNSCCGDPRVRAAVAISGSELPYGGDWSAPPATPLLLVHGQDDHVVGFASSQHVFDTFPGPRAFLVYPGATHASQFQKQPGVLLDAAVVAFLDRWLRHDPAPWQALPPKVRASGVATLTERG